MQIDIYCIYNKITIKICWTNKAQGYREKIIRTKHPARVVVQY